MATAFNRVRYLYQLGASDTASFDVTVAGDAPGGLITDYAGLLAYAGRVQHQTPARAPVPAQGIVALTGAGSNERRFSSADTA